MRNWIAGPALLYALALSACATPAADLRAPVVAARPACEDKSVQIYFEPDSAEVTAEGKAVIGQAARAAQSCTVVRVDVLGLADASGAPDPNLELSQRRAQSVTAVLANAGLPDAEFHLTALGQAGAVAPDGAARPLRRRVDVVLRLQPKT